MLLDRRTGADRGRYKNRKHNSIEKCASEISTIRKSSNFYVETLDYQMYVIYKLLNFQLFCDVRCSN